MENFNENEIRYLEAKKRVKRIKGFYIHAMVYVIVNIAIILSNAQFEGKGLGNLDNYWTAIFWGIGLLAHGLSVFMPAFIFGNDWEERKIRELMNK